MTKCDQELGVAIMQCSGTTQNKGNTGVPGSVQQYSVSNLDVSQTRTRDDLNFYDRISSVQCCEKARVNDGRDKAKR